MWSEPNAAAFNGDVKVREDEEQVEFGNNQVNSQQHGTNDNASEVNMEDDVRENDKDMKEEEQIEDPKAHAAVMLVDVETAATMVKEVAVKEEEEAVEQEDLEAPEPIT